MTRQDDEQLAWRVMETGDYEEAFRLLAPLAACNSEYALLSLGWIYETGALGAQETVTARTYYERAAREGSAEAYHRLGRLLLSQGDEQQARAAFEQGAELGDDESKSMLGELADKSNELLACQAIEASDPWKALALLEPLASRNSVYALLGLGWIYETGALGAQETVTARTYYERAAREGSAEAYRRLGGLLLSQGEEEQARAAFGQGARKGNISCMYWLGILILEERGDHAEISEGIAWLEKAAVQGHFFAKRKLLTIEDNNAKSLLKRLSIKWQIGVLAKVGFKEFLRDPESDKNR